MKIYLQWLEMPYLHLVHGSPEKRSMENLMAGSGITKVVQIWLHKL